MRLTPPLTPMVPTAFACSPWTPCSRRTRCRFGLVWPLSSCKLLVVEGSLRADSPIIHRSTNLALILASVSIVSFLNPRSSCCKIEQENRQRKGGWFRNVTPEIGAACRVDFKLLRSPRSTLWHLDPGNQSRVPMDGTRRSATDYDGQLSCRPLGWRFAIATAPTPS